MTLTPLVNLGNGFEVGSAVRVATPFQGDPTLSPSGGLLSLRVMGKELVSAVDGRTIVTTEQSGYALYTVSAASGNTC